LEPKDFLFTWKPDKWPYEKLRKLVDSFETGRVVIESWRCQAHKRVRPGARGYFLKQGGRPRGVFAVGEVIGLAEERADPKPGEAPYAVPIRFDLLSDPTKRFLVSESDLSGVPVRWDTQASGVVLEASAARAIDAVISMARTSPPSYSPDDGDASSDKRERLAEVCQRDQTLANEL
jgi:hypothetical protein